MATEPRVTEPGDPDRRRIREAMGCLHKLGRVPIELLTSQVRDFFRYCPSCGRRFHVSLVNKLKTGEEEVTEVLPPGQDDPRSGLKFATRADTELTEGKPVYVDVKEFNYTYRCTHCGHQWTESHEKDSVSRE